MLYHVGLLADVLLLEKSVVGLCERGEGRGSERSVRMGWEMFEGRMFRNLIEMGEDKVQDVVEQVLNEEDRVRLADLVGWVLIHQG